MEQNISPIRELCATHVVLNYSFYTLTLHFLESGERQWEAGAAGQTADQTQRAGQQSPDLLPDGQNVGPSGWISCQETLHIPGKVCSYPGLRSESITRRLTQMMEGSGVSVVANTFGQAQSLCGYLYQVIFCRSQTGLMQVSRLSLCLLTLVLPNMNLHKSCRSTVAGKAEWCQCQDESPAKFQRFDVSLCLSPLQRLDGSIKGEIRKQALDHFNAEGSEVCTPKTSHRLRGRWISSLKMGLGIEAAAKLIF